MSAADELRRIWLFEGLTEDQLDSLSPFTYRKNFGPGELIVEEGHTGNGMYLIVSGMWRHSRGWGPNGNRPSTGWAQGRFSGRWRFWGSGPGRQVCAQWTTLSAWVSTDGCFSPSSRGSLRWGSGCYTSSHRSSGTATHAS